MGYGEWQHDPLDVCPKCGEWQIRWRIWESSDGAHEDHQYECENCGFTRWIDGPDY